MNFKDYNVHTLLMIFCTAMTIVGAQIAFKVGLIPYTFQNFGLILAGLLLQPKHALMSQLLYITLIGLGLPVAAGFRGGPYILIGHTSGYLWMFPVTSYIMSLISRKYIEIRGRSLDLMNKFDIISLLILSLISALPLYLVGGFVFAIYTIPVLPGKDIISVIHEYFKYSLLLNIPFMLQDLLMDHLAAIITARQIYKLLRVKGMIP